MYIDIPKNTRVIVLEGIAGSGKTTLLEYLKQQFKSSRVYVYLEQELLLGWKHVHIPHVSALRIEFMNLFLDELEKNLEQKKEAIFILERFHLSMKILEWEFEKNFDIEYQKIVERVKKLPVHVLISELRGKQIKERMHHRERSRQWREYCEEKLVLRGFADLESVSIAQQEALFEAAQEQGIPYSSVQVQLNR
ncbi:MAG: AAA family ATPase [Proteobacteria bacterium]|nr:AAA family ATPase [Pseudomonadota bacterium]